MPDVQAPNNDDAAHSNLPASNPDQVEQASHGRRSSEQVTTEQNAASSATEPPAEVSRERENPSVNGHASGEDQGEQQPAQTVLQSSSAGAQEKSLPSASTVNPSIEKPVDDSSTHAVSVSKTKSTTSMPAAKSRTSRQKKPSILSRLFKALVPCVGPSKAHDVDADNASATALREKQPDEEKKEKAQEASSTSIGHGHSPEPSSATLTTLPNPPTIVPSQYVPSVPPAESNVDAVVIVPPSPSRRLPTDETGGVTSAAVQPPGSTGTEDHEVDHGTDHSDGDQSSFRTEDDDGHDRAEIGAGLQDDEDYDEEERLIMNGGAGIPIGPDGLPRPLLPEVAPQHIGRKCLVLDLDETLVHSSFKLIPQADYVVPVEIEWQWHNVYVIKRPGVDNFLKQMGELYEVVVFTASLSKYADPVLDKLDVHKVVSHRLFRESCYNHKGNYVKDLSQLGRPASSMIILDNSPASYIFHPNNAVPVSSWFNDPHDTELTDLVPFLADLRLTDDVRGVLDGGL